MSSSKKKSKTDKIPKPISIKKEKTEEDRTLHPISHYIDDRLALVKQIFCTLKPKTIRNLAPEFLKKTNLDEIEELCLNELLCISTKRLKSIIDGTRCPTDTESSEDSDVEHQEEHISLEEISSDSDIGGSESRRAKKKKKLSTKGTGKTTENKAPEGQISVLELLELQARARAIRSQLAMEPITKIEVNSDEDNPTTGQKERQSRKQDKTSINRKVVERKRKSSSNSKDNPSNGKDASPQKQTVEVAPKKKIKLKRNYRNVTKSPENVKSTEKSVEIPTTSEQSLKKLHDKSRSPSPDVIPIQAEPETLLISDSTDDEAKQSSEAAPIQAKAIEPPAPLTPAKDSEPEEGEVTDDDDKVNEGSKVPEKPEEKQSENESTVETPKEQDVEKAAEVSVEKESVRTEPEESNISTIEDAAAAERNSIVDDEDQNDDIISIGGDLENEMIEIEELANEVSVKNETTENSNEPEEEDNDVISLETSEDERDKLQEINPELYQKDDGI
ncbi:muscle M-line assembly protein unc-89 isoform X2 [Scaptodrosophila lebanonensis]|uniref:Muscle M-line assembly protein unc-89 isoform X2 n=1 Tax=Drosophila lebanonensis TaxID=7225 RepID=A0A6J2U9Y6_DROLE|nr:muscle M-line assembly protein unc-89 isoform X2 [Scaptodrosophila lebanonensis]